ncbi:MAG TPA: hypothetical protein VNJ08_10810 [Bacteriovoracaceae bacterium]|nr:hypothetical protein [Bacteriovoracaceae bacterium]
MANDTSIVVMIMLLLPLDPSTSLPKYVHQDPGKSEYNSGQVSA